MNLNENSIIEKIKNFFKRIFFRNKKLIEDKKDNLIDNTAISEPSINKEMNFLNSLKIEDKNEILNLQIKFENKQITISEITDEQLHNLNELYRTQISKLKEELKIKKKELVDAEYQLYLANKNGNV